MTGTMPRRVPLPLAIVLPAVLVAVGVLAWSAWSSSRDHRVLARLAGDAARERALTEALSQLSVEVGYVIALRGIAPDELPATLAPYASGAKTLSSARTSREILGLLVEADDDGPEALRRLRRTGAPVTPALKRALAPLPPATRRALTATRGTSGLPLRDYADALADLQRAFVDAQPRSRAALEELGRLAGEPPPWAQPQFLALAAGLLALVLAAAGWTARRVARRVGNAEAGRSETEARADELARRNARLLATVDASRRMTSASDVRSVARAVAVEAQELLGAAAGAVYLLDESADVARPAAAVGEPAAAAFPAGEGTIGWALDTGLPTRAVVAGDPAFPGSEVPLSIVVAPLVADRRVTGALVVASPGAPLAGDEEEVTLRLVALAAATTIEMARAHDSTARLAHTDPLTGVGNRRRLDSDLAALAPAEYADGVAFLMIDVDHFKAYNDAHGHPAGDAVLRQVAQILCASVRETDVVYRFGGEEFAVLLRGASDEEARAVAARIRSAVAGHAFPGAETQPAGRVTVSVGVSRRCDGDAAALVAEADGALYRAKREGRDRVVAAS
jgi:diguanylate cyclase (GGDEF)-like protein